jgi:quinoprotein glucose dehydrogenase
MCSFLACATRVVLLGLGFAGAAGADPASSEWPSWGNDPGGSRYAPLTQIDRRNVGRLEQVWTYRTGDWKHGEREVHSEVTFEATPILVDDTLYLCTPFNRVIALDPRTGQERWTYDPEIDLVSSRYANQLVCRGVSTWVDGGAEPGAVCRRRILTATNDARLIALDAKTGRPCAAFGAGGQVDLKRGVGEIQWPGEYQVTSPPAVVGDVVVVGSAISDNQRIDAPSGVIRGFDARSGAQIWSWDLAPPDFERGHLPSGEPEHVLGTPNVWAVMSADPERDLVYVPTGNPSPDYYRGGRPPLDYYGSSVVALRASTGDVVWHFQTVHHDLWDYDVPAQPTLFSLRRDGQDLPALVQPTKMGLLFVLDRKTGDPLIPVEERPVPQDGAPGEVLSKTQPFPVKPPPLVRQRLRPEDAWGLTPFDRRWCRHRIEALRSDGIYTPPSLQGSVMYPGNAGGSNWGGVAVDAERQLLVANVIDLPWLVTLLPSADFARARAENPGVEISPQTGAPYAMRREVFLSPLFVPCNRPPWGKLAAVDLSTGDIRWEMPFGGLPDKLHFGSSLPIGAPNLGGPLLTGSGLLFIGAAMDGRFRAYDAETGVELWKAGLPAGGQATPMTYMAEGRQYVVIAAGGNERALTRMGDYVVAFALPE